MAAPFLAVPVTATAGDPINIALLNSYGKATITFPATGRYHTALGTLATNFLQTQQVTDAAPRVEYKLLFNMSSGAVYVWTFATQGALDTAYTDVNTALTTEPGP